MRGALLITMKKAFSYNLEKGTTDPIREYILIVE